MALINLPLRGNSYGPYAIKGLTAGTSDVVVIPPEVQGGITIALVNIGAGSAKIQFTTSQMEDIQSGTANWQDWAQADVTVTTMFAYSRVNGLRAVVASGTWDFEITTGGGGVLGSGGSGATGEAVKIYDSTGGSLTAVGGALSTIQLDSTGGGTITAQDTTPTGTSSANSSVSMLLEGTGTVSIQVTGTWVAGALTPYVSNDGAVWVAMTNALVNTATNATTSNISSGANGIYQCEVAGHSRFKLSCVGAPPGGTGAVVTLNGSSAMAQITVQASALPSGAATAANQATTNTTLSTISGKLPNIGPQLSAASQSVTFATDDADIGAAGTGLTAPTGGSGMLGYLSGIYAGGKVPSYIQGAYANATSIDLITGNSTSGNPANSWTDVTGWDYFVATIATDASGSGITVLLEGTNDTTLDPAGAGLLSMDPSSTTLSASQTTASALGASAFQRRFGPLPFRYIRLRVSALTAGQVKATIQLRRGTNPSAIVNAIATATTTTQAGASATSGGLTTFHHAISAASTNATSVKGSAGSISSIVVSNNNAAMAVFKLFNKASAPSVGSDSPIASIMIPPNGTVVFAQPIYMRMSTGIAYALTTGMAVADTGAVALSQCSVHITYV